MSNVLYLLPSDGWQRLLIDALWQSTIIAAFGWIIARFMVRLAAARAWLLLLSLTACTVAPLASMAARSAAWTVLPPAKTASIGAVPYSDGQVTPTLTGDPGHAAAMGRPGADYSAVAATPPLRAIAAYSTQMNWLALMAIVWLSASAILLVRLAISLMRVCQLFRHAEPCSEDALLSAASEASRRFGLVDVPSIYVSKDAPSPMVLAFARPALLVPAARGATGGEINWTAAFTHELAHVVRRDGWSRLWVQLITIALPLQPLVWVVRRSFFTASEEACDDWAVASGSDPVDLATTISAWVDRHRRVGALAAIGMSGTKARMLRLLAMRNKPCVTTSTAWRWISIHAAVLLITGMAVAQSPNESANEEETTASQRESTTNKEAKQRPKTITISGSCTDDKKTPLAGVQVRLFSILFNPEQRSQRQLLDLRSDDLGNFQFANVPLQQTPEQGEVLVVVAQATGRATASSGTIEPQRPRKRTFDLVLPESAAVRGRVTDVDGTPVSGALVSTGRGGLWESVPGICAAVTDADGRYEIADLRPFKLADRKPQPTGDGGFIMAGASFGDVQHPDYAHQRIKYTQIPSTIDVTLHRAAVVEGQVVYAENERPAVGARVEIHNDDIGPDYWTRTITDERGQYRLATLPPGTYYVSVELSGRPNLFRPDVLLKSGHNKLDLRMDRGGKIKGRVIDVSTGKLIALGKDESMSISPHDRRGVSRSGMGSAHIQPDGTFELQLPAGRNYLGMYLGSNWRGVNTDSLSNHGIEVPDGKTVELEIRVKPRTPDDEKPPQPLSAEEAVQLSERAATAAIKQLGGWVATERIDGHDHVVEVNMVYHEDELEGRQENRLLSDECLSYVRKFPKLKRLLLARTQATDAGLAHLHGAENLETIMMWDASEVTDAGAAHLATLPNLKSIHLSNSQITDESLRSFSGLVRLERLSLQGNHFTDNGLDAIKGMTQLKDLMLGLGRNEITDDGLRHLSRLVNLERLDLQRSKVTDAGLTHLQGLKNLRELWLNGTAVTEPAVAELRKSLPNLSKR